MEGDAIDTGEDDRFYSPTARPDDPNRNRFDTFPGGDDDGKHEHIDLSWDKGEVSTSTRRGSAEDTRSKLAELESSKDDAWKDLLGKYPEADPKIITASKDEFGRTVIYLLNRKNAARYPLLDDGTIGRNKKGGAPGKTLLDALGPKAEDIIKENDEFMRVLEEMERKALTIERSSSQQNKEYDELQQAHKELQQEYDIVNRRLDFVNNKIFEAQNTLVKKGKEYRKVIEKF